MTAAPLTDADLSAAASALRQCHDETGIELDNWTPVRRLVEAYTGPLYDEEEGAPVTPSDYTIGLPVTVRVYPDGAVVFLVHPEDAVSDVEALDGYKGTAPQRADLVAIEAALDDRTATGLVDRRP